MLLLGDALGFWVAVKVLFALFGRIMGALTALVARSPPFFVDHVALFGSFLVVVALRWWCVRFGGGCWLPL